MQRNKRIFVFLAMAVLLIGMNQLVLAGTGCPEDTEGSWLERAVDKHAKGMEVDATLTVYQQWDGGTYCLLSDGSDFDFTNPQVTLTYFLRVQVPKSQRTPDGRDEYGFSLAQQSCILNYDEQKTTLEGLIQTCVIPTIFPGKPDAPFAFKKVSKLVTEDPFQYPNGLSETCTMIPGEPMFILMDLVIAVERNKHCHRH